MNLDQLQQEATRSLAQAASAAELEQLRVKYLGRKSVLALRLKEIGDLPAAERATAGQEANTIRQALERALEESRARLRAAGRQRDSQLDLSQPVATGYGHKHPVAEVQADIIRLFWQMGFEVVSGPEIEQPWYNFDALNIPPDHPARDMQDTFYLEGELLPRTHTSNVQVRYMEQNKPPVRIIAPGKVYRNEDEDASHLWMFNQVEGLVVDEGVTLADLKGTLLQMTKGLLGEETDIRLRQSYFPYTEPSVEVDATCAVCKGSPAAAGCRTCGGSGWLELMGAGMVHPQVLRNVRLDPEVYSGFAFGLGVERIAAIKYQVPDIRHFWRPDLRFLEQF